MQDTNKRSMERETASENENSKKHVDEISATVSSLEKFKNEKDDEKSQLRKDLKAVLVSSDRATIFAHPGLRFAYTCISWFVMGYETPDGKGFFIASFLFSLSLAFDYGKFNPRDSFRKKTRVFGAWWNSIWSGISFMGVLGALTIVTINGHAYVQITNYALFNNSEMPFWILLILLGLTIPVTAVDWISEKREIEKLVLSDH